VSWLEAETAIVVLGNFIACQIAQEAGLTPTGRLSVQVNGSLLRLTCVSGAECTLAFSEEATAAYWALLCLTDQLDAVPGAIANGNLIAWRTSFWPISEAIPERRDIVRRMRNARKRLTYRGIKPPTPKIRRNPSIGELHDDLLERIEM